MHVFVSYPKSGRTWVRFMVNNYLAQVHNLPVNNVFDVEKLFEGSERHVFWTHFNGAMLFKQPYWQMGFNYKQVLGHPCLMLVRNFYGTLASAYYHARYRKAIFDGTPSEFVRSPLYGAIKLISHYNQVATLAPAFPRFEVFVYERIREDPAGQLAAILQALQVEVQPDLVGKVVEEGKLPNMQRLAAQPQYAGTVLEELNPDAPCNQHTTTGNNKKYRELFTEEDLQLVARLIDDVLVDKSLPYLEGLLEPPPVKSDKVTTQSNAA